MITRLTTQFWVSAHIRLADQKGQALVVVKRGDATSGAVVIKINRLGPGCVVLSQTRQQDETLAWLRLSGPGLMSEEAADALIQRQLRFDPDLWVLEYENGGEEWPVSEPIL